MWRVELCIYFRVMNFEKTEGRNESTLGIIFTFFFQNMFYFHVYVTLQLASSQISTRRHTVEARLALRLFLLPAPSQHSSATN